MKFKAELIDVPGLPKPVVTNSEVEASIEDWTKKILAKYPPSKYPEARIVVSVEIIKPIAIYRRSSDDNDSLEQTVV